MNSEESGLQEVRLARGSSRFHLGTVGHIWTSHQSIFSKYIYLQYNTIFYIIHLLNVHSTFYSSSVHRICNSACTTFITAAFSCLKNSVKDSGFCTSAQAPLRDDCISTSRFNTQKLTKRKKK